MIAIDMHNTTVVYICLNKHHTRALNRWQLNFNDESSSFNKTHLGTLCVLTARTHTDTYTVQQSINKHYEWRLLFGLNDVEYSLVPIQINGYQKCCFENTTTAVLKKRYLPFHADEIFIQGFCPYTITKTDS